MDGNRSRVGPCKMSINDTHEFGDNVIGWSRTINKKQVVVLDVLIFKEPLVVFFFVQADDPIHSHFLEDFAVFLRVVTKPLVGIAFFDGPHEGNEPARNDPVEVPIFDSFIEFILFDVESSEVIPFLFDSELEALQTLKKSALIEAVTFAGVSVMLKKLFVPTESSVSFLCREFQNNYHEGPHQECTVDHFVCFFTVTIVEDSVFGVGFVSEESSKLS
jgi:hypothetical protein